jgi:hypothetical protein
MELSAGKYWVLRRLSDGRGFFRMTAVDQRPPIRTLVASRRGVKEASHEGRDQQARRARRHAVLETSRLQGRCFTPPRRAGVLPPV